MAFNWSTVKAINSVGNSRFSAAHGHFSGQHELLDRGLCFDLVHSKARQKSGETYRVASYIPVSCKGPKPGNAMAQKIASVLSRHGRIRS